MFFIFQHSNYSGTLIGEFQGQYLCERNIQRNLTTESIVLEVTFMVEEGNLGIVYESLSFTNSLIVYAYLLQ